MNRPPVFVLLAGLILLAADVRADGLPEPRIAGVRVGLAGRYKPGVWTPVEVTVRGASRSEDGRVVLTVPDGDGVPSRFSAPLPCPGDADGSAADNEPGETSVSLCARFGRVKSELSVEYVVDGRTVHRRVFRAGEEAGFRPAVLSERDLVVTVGRGRPGVDEAVRLSRRDPEQGAVVVPIEEFRELPAHWCAYEGIDTVVLATSDPEVYDGLEASSQQVAALDEWVKNGGKLVFCVGSEAGEVLRQEPEAPLARFSPGRLERTVDLRHSHTTALEVYSGCSVRIPPPGIQGRIPYLTGVEGTIEARDRRLPLVVRTARGFGQVVFVAADLDRPPYSEWDERGLLVARLLDYPAMPVEEEDQGTAVMHYGFADLAGQLRSALDQFPDLWLTPFSLVVTLIVLYVLAIGPGDYFLLRKVIRRMQLTWITFPLIVVAFSVTAYVLAERFKGDQVRVNQVDLVDVDLASGRLRGTGWANLFSPRMQRYHLCFQPKLPGSRLADEATALTAWLGLPGDALGGMNPRAAEPGRWRAYYDFSDDLDALHDVPVPIRATKSLTGRWVARTDTALKGRLVEEDGLPVGTVTNPLGFPLVECMLAYGNHAYELGTIGPGESIEVGPMRRRRVLRSLLTGRQIVFDKEADRFESQATPYDRSSVDVAYILRAMMFFEAAGGRRYTGLSNQYQGFVDLSGLLKTSRAVLVGRAQSGSRAPHHGAELLCNGRPLPPSQVRHTTIYRFVFPVETEDRLQEAAGPSPPAASGGTPSPPAASGGTE